MHFFCCHETLKKLKLDLYSSIDCALVANATVSSVLKCCRCPGLSAIPPTKHMRVESYYTEADTCWRISSNNYNKEGCQKGSNTRQMCRDSGIIVNIGNIVLLNGPITGLVVQVWCSGVHQSPANSGDCRNPGILCHKKVQPKSVT